MGIDMRKLIVWVKLEFLCKKHPKLLEIADFKVTFYSLLGFSAF